MSTSTTFKIVGLPNVRAPRGALWGAALFLAAWEGLTGLFTTAAHAPSRAEEAASVREMARRIQVSDPGFAADLLAAADRHEAGAA